MSFIKYPCWPPQKEEALVPYVTNPNTIDNVMDRIKHLNVRDQKCILALRIIETPKTARYIIITKEPRPNHWESARYDKNAPKGPPIFCGDFSLFPASSKLLLVITLWSISPFLMCEIDVIARYAAMQKSNIPMK